MKAPGKSGREREVGGVNYITVGDTTKKLCRGSKVRQRLRGYVRECIMVLNDLLC